MLQIVIAWVKLLMRDLLDSSVFSLFASKQTFKQNNKHTSHRITSYIRPIERRAQNDSGCTVGNAQRLCQLEVLQHFHKTGKKKNIKRHPRNSCREKYPHKTIYQHYHQHISDIRTYEIVTYIQSYQHLYTKDQQKADYIKNSFLHYSLNHRIKHSFESANIR